MFLNTAYTQALRFVCTTKCWNRKIVWFFWSSQFDYVWLLSLIFPYSWTLNSFSFAIFSLFLSFFVIFLVISPFLSHFHSAIIFFFYFKNFHTSENETQLIQLSIYLCIIQSSFRTVGRCSRRIDAIDQNKLFAVYGCSVDMCI